MVFVRYIRNIYKKYVWIVCEKFVLGMAMGRVFLYLDPPCELEPAT